jgi:hypothetical protein
MTGPVKVLLHAAKIYRENGEWHRTIGANSEYEPGFFRPTWFRYLPQLGSRCPLIRLVKKEDRSPADEDGVVFEMKFDDQLDYVEVFVGMLEYRWTPYSVFFTKEQGWLAERDQCVWPAPPVYT